MVRSIVAKIFHVATIFFILPKTNFNISDIFILLSANAFNLDQSGKESTDSYQLDIEGLCKL